MIKYDDKNIHNWISLFGLQTISLAIEVYKVKTCLTSVLVVQYSTHLLDNPSYIPSFTKCACNVT